MVERTTMKIRFVKEYRALQQSAACDVYEVGLIDDATEDEAQWLIDNGFAEEVKESSLWEPEYGEKYYYLDSGGCISRSDWKYTGFDAWRHDIGNVFKTEELAQRFVDYLKAVEVVSHDEGFMKISRKIDYSPRGYGVYRGFGKSIIAEVSDMAVSAGEFYFDTYEHAKASVKTHQNEWQTILNYDWSKE